MDSLPTIGRRLYIPLDVHGRPHKDWSGIVQAGKVVRAWINQEHPEHVTTDEAEEQAEAIVRAYLGEQS